MHPQLPPIATPCGCFFFFFVILAGCGRSQPESSPPTSYGGQTADEYFKDVLLKYRGSSAYRDQAVARLTYELDGRLLTEQAPLSVWKSGSAIYIKAYDVHIWSDSKVTMAWIRDEATSDHDSQVVRLPRSSTTFDPDQMMEDPVLADKLSGGLAGPPPQLDWLFADQPMQRMFEEDHQIQFGEQRKLGDQELLTISVTADGERFWFWIDPATSLIHRVDFPNVTSPDDPAQTGRLTLALPGARFQLVESPVADDLPTQPRFVSRFVPLPNQEPAQGLGRAMDEFRLSDPTGEIVVTNRGSDREVTVLLVADKESSLGDVMALNQWASMMSPEVESRVRSVVIASLDVKDRLPADLLTPIVFDAEQVAQQAITAANRGATCELVVVDQRGRIAWLQETLTPQHFHLLGPIIGDVLDGVDVPGRLLGQWRSSVADYRSRLSTAVAKHRAEYRAE